MVTRPVLFQGEEFRESADMIITTDRFSVSDLLFRSLLKMLFEFPFCNHICLFIVRSVLSSSAPRT